MTAPTTQSITPDLVRGIARDLLRAAAMFDGDAIDVYRTSTAITEITPDAPTWQVTTVAAGLARKIAGRTSIEDPTDDPAAATVILRELRRSTTYGLFTRSITFADARVMTAIIDMAEAAEPGDYRRTTDLAWKWDLRFHIVESWRLQYVTVQLLRFVADWTGDPLAMLDTIANEI